MRTSELDGFPKKKEYLTEELAHQGWTDMAVIKSNETIEQADISFELDEKKVAKLIESREEWSGEAHGCCVCDYDDIAKTLSANLKDIIRRKR